MIHKTLNPILASTTSTQNFLAEFNDPGGYEDALLGFKGEELLGGGQGGFTVGFWTVVEVFGSEEAACG